MKLTKRQEAFIYEYLTNGFNATQAYLKVFKTKNPDQARYKASRLLQKDHIQKKIQEELKKRQAKYEATTENIVKELSNIAFSDIFELIDIQDDRTIILKSKDQLKEIDKKAVQSITYDAKTGSIKIKMHDKLKALELLGKHLGMFDGEKPDTTQLSKLQEIIEGLKNAIPE